MGGDVKIYNDKLLIKHQVVFREHVCVKLTAWNKAPVPNESKLQTAVL